MATRPLHHTRLEMPVAFDPPPRTLIGEFLVQALSLSLAYAEIVRILAHARVLFPHTN